MGLAVAAVLCGHALMNLRGPAVQHFGGLDEKKGWRWVTKVEDGKLTKPEYIQFIKNGVKDAKAKGVASDEYEEEEDAALNFRKNRRSVAHAR